MTEKKTMGLGSLLDMAEEGMDMLERALPDVENSDLLRDSKGREIIDIPEVVPNSHKLLRLRVELYTACQTLSGDDLKEFRKLISEIYALLFSVPVPKRLPNGG